MKDTTEGARLRSGFEETLDRVAERAARALVAQGRVRSDAFRAALSRRLTRPATPREALIGDPVFEASRIWKNADRRLGELAGELLLPELVGALDAAGEKRFARDWFPYLHQLQAWEVARAGRSYMVTSGTGSGKTECFMVPMIDDLLRQAGGRRLQGTGALVIYPLNALIDSQRERLSAWIAPFDDRLSFATYNGDTPDQLRKAEARLGAEIRDRATLRTDPASVLVTNVTMLEYLLLRAQDRAILDQSKGKLRWIVLDEAHSYVGAQAAEMALLLRRVRQAFEVAPEDVRLVATSATIGEGNETREALRSFVADLAGISTDRVDVIEGLEELTPLPEIGPDFPVSLDELPVDETGLWHRIAPHPKFRAVRQAMRDGGVSLGSAATILGSPGAPLSRAAAMEAVEAAALARDPHSGHRFAPWRMHAFHRAQAGLWACVDPECKSRDVEFREDGTDWPFGRLHLEPREHCSCGAPIFEVVACDECATPWLRATRSFSGANERLSLELDGDDEDDYAFEHEPDSDAEIVHSDGIVYVGPTGARSVPDLWLRLKDRQVFTTKPEGHSAAVQVVEDATDRGCCARAQEKSVSLKPRRFGAPFLMGNAMPLLLEAVPSHDRSGAEPSDGRRLLSFTDSRQGTARFSAKLQQDAERNLTRAVIYHAVQAAGQNDPTEVAALRSQIAGLEKAVETVPSLSALLTTTRAKLEAALGNSAGRVSWRDMISRLAGHSELRGFAGEIWKSRPKGGDILGEEPGALAELMLFRELFRRPRMQNNVETMGLARLVFPELEAQAKLRVPSELAEAGHGEQAWCDLLHAAVDLVFRANLAVSLSEAPVDIRHWISPRGRTKSVLPPTVESEHFDANLHSRFPSAKGESLLTALCFMLSGGSPSSATDIDRVGRLLAAIWTTFESSGLLVRSSSLGYRLRLERAEIAALRETPLCLRTGKMLPYAPAGLSLNAIDRRNPVASKALTRLVALPIPPLAEPAGLSEVERARLRDWLAIDPQVARLRSQGLWSNLHDRIVEFTPFLRSAEHSAQIDRGSLRTFEVDFKAHRINILNCSTTMEMGVDIPDVSVVVNTNVPPAPSNYRQRVGRAGRRGEPWALSFTFCKDQPLDRRVFSDPHTLLQGEVRAPSVRLDSAIVLQRHANSLLLAMHLRASSGGIKVTKNIGSFFGATDPTLDSASKQPILHDSAASGFLDALKGAWGAEGKVLDALRLLARGAPVADPALLRDRCIRDFSALQRKWEEEYRALLTAQEAAGSDSVVRGFYVNRANRMRREFLLTELARRNFTPAYGFPVDVVTFEHYDRNSGPSRPLSTAIRDYAPGTEVVIDGLVYRSEGILPSWSNRENPDRIEDLRTHWTCRECRAFGIERNPPEACPRCDGRVNRFELLKPSGFLGTKTPHAAYEALDFVPPEPPQISADSGFWTALPDPDAGRFRATRAGRVVTTSAGKDGSGYAICITCGRAEAETQGTDALSKAMKEHRPLQRPKGEARRDGRCLGTEAASLRIRRHVRLGSETITDVFELQLETLSWNKEGRRKGLAIVAALREALCSRLGIGAEEVGVGVARGLSSGGIERVSMFLYDLAAGGAGFAVSAEAEISSLMVDAARRLDCPSACTHGCPECILRRDLQFDMRAIDRPGGYEAMIRDVLPHLALPEDLRVFGSESTAVTRSLEAEILSCLGGGGVEEVILTLPGDDRDWDLPRWPGGRVIRRASEAGAATRVMSAVRSITYFDYPERMDLLRLTARGDAGLSLTQNLPEAGGYPILALLRKGASWRAILSPDETVVLPDGEWGQADRMPLIAGPAPEFNPGHLVEAVDLAKHGLPNSTEALVLKEFDGPLSEFGRKFWDKVREVRPQAFRPGLRLARLCYSDRYLHAPAPVALLMQVLATAPGRDPVTEVRVESEAKRPPRGATGLANTPLPDRLHHNWEDDSIRKRVLTGVLGAKVDLLDKRSVDHARIVRLQFEDGSCVSVRLDQGLGSWRVQEAGRDPFFDFEASANKQVEAISCLNREVLFSNPRYPTPVTVSWEASRIESRCC